VLLGVAGGVLGTVARSRIAQEGGSGAGVARAGQIAGWIVAALSLVLTALTVWLVLNGFQSIDRTIVN
jgi:hypothetical protein